MSCPLDGLRARLITRTFLYHPLVSGCMPGIDVVRGTGLKQGRSTPGILREQAFESSNVLVSRTRLDRGAISGWHHHGRTICTGSWSQGGSDWNTARPD